MTIKNPDIVDDVSINGYVICKWTSIGSGEWIIPNGIDNADILVIGGGGGGGSTYHSGAAGGGGAGGFREIISHVLIPGSTVNITVGNGGIKHAIGGNSVFDNIISAGGGYGGSTISDYSDYNGISGGSGGGGAGRRSGGSGGGLGNVPPTDPPQGYNGGTGYRYPSSYGRGGGGGGGASEQGHNATYRSGGNGGNGKVSNITGKQIYYAGGGGGGGGTYYGQPGEGLIGSGGTVRTNDSKGYDGIIIVKYKISSVKCGISFGSANMMVI